MIETHAHNGALHLHLFHSLNPLSFERTSFLANLLEKADGDDSIQCTIISGSETAFSVGADLKELCEKKPEDIDAWLEPWEKVYSFSKPLIMVLKGYVLGGGLEIALMGDILIAHPETKLGQPEIKLGLIPGCGGTQRLVHAMGYYRAFELCATGGMIDALQAKECNLINDISPDPLSHAFDLAEKMSHYPLDALRKLKQTLRHNVDPVNAKGLSFERKTFIDLLKTEEAQHRLQQFSKKH